MSGTIKTINNEAILPAMIPQRMLTATNQAVSSSTNVTFNKKATVALIVVKIIIMLEDINFVSGHDALVISLEYDNICY